MLCVRLFKGPSGESENVTIQLADGSEFVEDNGVSVSRQFKDNDISASKYSKKLRNGYDNLITAIKAVQVHIVWSTK